MKQTLVIVLCDYAETPNLALLAGTAPIYLVTRVSNIVSDKRNFALGNCYKILLSSPAAASPMSILLPPCLSSFQF